MYPNDTESIVNVYPTYPASNNSFSTPGSRYGSTIWQTDDGTVWFYGGQARLSDRKINKKLFRSLFFFA